jgi:hypothetical protein
MRGAVRRGEGGGSEATSSAGECSFHLELVRAASWQALHLLRKMEM